ncbi:MAG TPA: CHRD domain-containing protein [Chthoniobacterales bacterium]|nr:CHRD domain-containing protein [Chthoniobacterales bacterium]
MKLIRLILLVLALAAVAPTPVFAQTSFYAILTQDQEPPPAGITPPTTSTGGPRPQAYGFASLTLNPAMTALSMVIQVFNLDVTGMQTPNDTNDNLQAAHIHAPAPAGMNAGVRWGFFGTPFNNNNPGDPMNGLVPFASGVGGTFNVTWDAPEGNNTTLAAQLQSIFDGLAYINFHSVQFGGGEIRGQILQAPEPASTGALLGLAALGLFAVRKRTRLAPR